MGKKSKRSRARPSDRSSSASAAAKASERKDDVGDDAEGTEGRNVSSVPPSAGRRRKDDQEEEEETMENLRFEDPYGDSFEEESVDEDDEDEWEDYDETTMEATKDDDDAKADFERTTDDSEERVRSWNPFSSTLGTDETLEMDESAYKMHHALTAEWPSLSFAFVRDAMGENRTRFPHSLIAVAGTQADRADKNKLNVMRLSDLGRIPGKKGEKEMDDEILGEEYDGNAGNDDDSESDSESEDEEVADDLDPILEHYSLRHRGGCNRVKVCPHRSELIASWSDEGKVNLYDIGGVLDVFERSAGGRGSGTTDRKIRKDPFFVYSGHDEEGYALDWSKVNPGTLATGDCRGNIHVWTPESPEDFATTDAADPVARWNNSSFRVAPAYAPSGPNLDNPSVEDIQWSPTEGTVFATGECGGCVKIYDTRSKHGPMIVNKIHPNGSDVNVLSWNASVSNLLATGGDDGTFAVWDLRTFQTKEGEKPEPLARFTNHRSPVTGMEWHPTDESMIAISDENGAYVYDLSVEEDDDDDNRGKEDGEGIPPQLLFVHCGNAVSTKEVHWHPQIASCLMTTSLSGFGVFIPSNL